MNCATASARRSSVSTFPSALDKLRLTKRSTWRRRFVQHAEELEARKGDDATRRLSGSIWPVPPSCETLPRSHCAHLGQERQHGDRHVLCFVQSRLASGRSQLCVLASPADGCM